MLPDDLKMVNNLTIYIIYVSLNTELNTLWFSGVFANTAHLSQLAFGQQAFENQYLMLCYVIWPKIIQL